MKIWCDVCDKDEASIFCTADEAALCAACDHRVHHANKLASKHQRLSLLHPSSSKESPMCDICQEKRAFLFCQQDRAILCRDCDIPIHTSNEHTKKHNRFLLTGVKLSSSSSLYKASLSPTSSASLTSRNDSSVPGSKSQPLIKKAHVTVSSKNVNQPSSATPSNGKPIVNKHNLLVNQTTTTISEYLIEMLPGWHVEDFLDSSPSPFGFCKNDDGLLPYLDTDLDTNRNIGSFQSENLGIWVPQAPQIPLNPNQFPLDDAGLTGIIKEAATSNMKLGNNNKRCSDDGGGFTVPQISPPSIGSKRSRSFC